MKSPAVERGFFLEKSLKSMGGLPIEGMRVSHPSSPFSSFGRPAGRPLPFQGLSCSSRIRPRCYNAVAHPATRRHSQVISREEVEHVARLARLHLDEEALERMGSELSQIIDYVQQIGELDLVGVEPTAHAVALTNVFRKDETWEGLTQDEALSNAPNAEAGHFAVPRMG